MPDSDHTTGAVVAGGAVGVATVGRQQVIGVDSYDCTLRVD